MTFKLRTSSMAALGPAILAVVFLSAVFIIITPSQAKAEEDPTISLVKTIKIRDYKGIKVPSDVYVVRSGDFLVKILRERGVTSTGRVPVEVIELINALNPKLRNPNLIYPGQKLVLPVNKVIGLDKLKPQAKSAGSQGKNDADPLSKIRFSIHEIKSGERLASLLRQANVPDKLIFNEYIKIVLRLNPDIKDQDIIYPGQLIKVPMFNPDLDSAQIARASRPVKRTVKIKPPEARLTPKKAKPARRAVTKTIIKSPEITDTSSLAIRTAIGLIFSRIGDQVISTGQHFLPIKSGGQITLNAPSFPIIKLRNNHRIILDLSNRLPDQMARLIRSHWSDYTIFQTKPGEKLPQMLDRLLKSSNYHQIHKKGQSVVISRDIEIVLKADWVIFPEKSDRDNGRAVVLNILSSMKTQGTNPEAALYLSNLGITVIDFFPKGNLIGPMMPAGDDTETPAESLTYNDRMDFIKAFLDLIGQKYAEDLSIPVLDPKEKDEDFHLSVHAPLYFNKNKIDYLVRFKGVSKELTMMVEKQGAKILVVNPNDDEIAAAKTILSATKTKYKTVLRIKASQRPASNNIEFIIPGISIQTGGERIFLTPMNLAPELIKLIISQGIRPITISKNADPS